MAQSALSIIRAANPTWTTQEARTELLKLAIAAKTVTLSQVSDMSANAKVRNTKTDAEVAAIVAPFIPSGAQRDLSILAGSGSSKGKLLGYSNGDTNADINCSSDSAYSCDPVVLVGGSALTTLSIVGLDTSAANCRITDTSGLTSLQSLKLTGCGYGTLTLADTRGLENLTSLWTTGGGIGNGALTLNANGLTALQDLKIYNHPSPFDFKTAIPDTSTLSNLESLGFSYCAYNGNFSLTDSSDLISLKTVSFYSTGRLGNFSITDLSGFVGITSISFNYCGTAGGVNITDTVTVLPEAKALLLMTAMDAPTYFGAGSDILSIKVTGTASLLAKKAALEAKGWTVTLAT